MIAKAVMLTLALFVLMNASMFVGNYEISFATYIEYLRHLLWLATTLTNDEIMMLDSVLLYIRLPRIVAAVLIGASLAISGASFQAMFVNPLVSPGILGVLSGASFGAALGMALGLSWLFINLFTFIFGFLAVLFALFISYIYTNMRNMIVLVLGGIISSSLFSALLSILKYSVDPYDALPAISYWLMGSLSFGSSTMLFNLAISMLVGVVTLVLFAKYLNALSLGDEEAKALGVDIQKIKIVVIFVATFISALSVILAGIIGWVGLVIPHITRFLFGEDNRVVVPMSALIGAIFLLVVDNFSRVMFSFEVPIGIITSLIGIPIFIVVLKNAKRSA